MKEGDKAPEFEAVDQHGNTHRLKDYKEKKIVLFFYPKASTPGCTQEAKNLRDHRKELEDEGYIIIGVSPDSVRRQFNFAQKNDLEYPLLTDEDHSIAEAYGVWGLKKMMGREYMGIRRTTFLIDEEGVISKIISKVKVKEHAEQILGGE